MGPILPLYEVNTETRDLIKRSSRAGDLKKRFKIREMSSISTFEFAWEHKSLWPSDWEDETTFCSGKLLTRINSSCSSGLREKRCKWNEWTIEEAAEQGNLEMGAALRCK